MTYQGNIEPGTIGLNETEDTWRIKDLNKCILEEDPECHLKPGTERDLPIVTH